MGMVGGRVAVIGGGIAGVSAAYALARHASDLDVVLLEAEGQLAHHTTGRSAAMLVENYGAMPVRSLTTAGLDFLFNPPEDLCSEPILSSRAVLTVGRAGQDHLIEEQLEQARTHQAEVEVVTPDETVELFPALRKELLLPRSILERGGQDIDVALLHQTFVRGMRAAGARVETSARVDAVTPGASPGTWIVESTAGAFEADLVVNAAGAWGDVVAERAGVAPLGLVPKRRTAFMVAGPDGAERWPFVLDVGNEYYIKPDGPQLLCSPADATPSEPVDARPEEIDVARTIDRICEATTLAIRSVRSSWAGLRTFAPDDSMVIGPDPEAPTFVWCVGQGGTGIQTSRAAGQLTADLALDGAPGSLFDGVPLELGGLTPERLRTP